MLMHIVNLLLREEVAESTMSFYFDKPAGFQFKPGPYLDCSLMVPPETDAEGNIAGPPAMATAMKETLTGAKVNEDDIRSEDFAGY
jgi:ferredoxin-NADP reductase